MPRTLAKIFRFGWKEQPQRGSKITKRYTLSVKQADAPITDNEIIRLKAQQIPAASEVLAKAFENDPMFSYIFPKDDERRMGKIKQLFLVSLRYSQPLDSIYTTDSLKGVAIWIPPGKYPMSFWQTVQLALTLPFKLGWGGMGRGIPLFNKIEECHQECMPEPHWYLNVSSRTKVNVTV